MSDDRDILSQDEINALLSHSGLDDMGDITDDGEEAGPGLSLSDYLNDMEQSALGEIGNISLGSAATALSTLLGNKTDITTPVLSVVKKSELENEFPKPHVAIYVNYTVGFKGVNVLVLKIQDAQIIADLMMGGSGDITAAELDEMHISAVQEAMNQMMGSAATSMSTMFNKKIDISPPGIDILDITEKKGIDNIPDEEMFIKIAFNLKIGTLINSEMVQLVTLAHAKEMVAGLLGEPTQPIAPSKASAKPPAAANETKPVGTQPPAAQQEQQVPGQAGVMPNEWGQYGQQPLYPPQMYPPQMYPPQMYPPQMYPPGYGYEMVANSMPSPPVNANVQPAQFSAFNAGYNGMGDSRNLGILMDIDMQVTVELGRTKKSVKEILELSPGSVLELNKLAGEPVDILVNNKLIAKGEVVVIEENFGVRVTDILSQEDRMQKLQ